MSSPNLPEKRRLSWIAWALFGLALIATAVFLIPRLATLVTLFSGFDTNRLLFLNVGMSNAWASTVAVVTSIVYALALAYLIRRGYFLIARARGSIRDLGLAVAAFVIVYALPHVINGVADAVAPLRCADQADGRPIKWYVVERDGRISLYDTDGFDRFGKKRQPVDPYGDICQIYEQQLKGIYPKQVTADARDIQFFDQITGRNLVWYANAANTTIVFYDKPGFDPSNGQPLSPVTPQIVSDSQQAAEQKRPRLPQSQFATRQCPGKLMPELVLGQDWVQINDGSCRVVFAVTSGDVEFDTKSSRYTFGPKDGGWVDRFKLDGRIARVHAASGTARLKYSLCPPDTENQRLNWDCSMRGGV